MSAEVEARLQILKDAPPGSWIALSEDESRLVAVGATFQEAAEKAHSAGVSDPVITKTPEDWTPRVL